MTSPTAPAPRPLRTDGQILRALLRWNFLAGALLFLANFGLFLGFTLQLDNDFSKYTKDNEVLLALSTNLRTLPAYAIVAVAYTLLGFPIIAWGQGFRERRLLRSLIQFAATNLFVFVTSLGFSSALNPGILDSIARDVSPIFPNFDYLSLYESPIVKLLLGLGIALTILAILRLSKLIPRPALVVIALLAIAGGVYALVESNPPRSTRDQKARLPNIVIVASDSLRADRLGCYGYKRGTSPKIDAIASTGVTLENLFVATASTLESWHTILTSTFPVSHGIRYMFPSKERVERASANPDALPRVLERLGYHTFVSSNWAGNCFRLVDHGFKSNQASDIQNLNVFLAEAALGAHWVFPLYFNNRFGEWLYPEVRQITSYLNPKALLDRFDRDLDLAVREGKPFFGILFTATTHLPYAASYPYNVKFVDRAYRGRNRYQIDFEVDTFMQEGFREGLTAEEVQHIGNLYDGTVAEFDSVVDAVDRRLQDRGVKNDTIFIITSDHGDDLYEPSTTLGHGTNFFGGDQTTRIPCVIRFPNNAHAGARVRQVTRTVDLAPTLLDHFQEAIPNSYQGVSLLAAISDPTHDLHLPAFAETCYLFFPKRGHPEGALTVRPADETLRIDPEFRNNFVLKEQYHEPVLASKDRMIRTNKWKFIHIPGESAPILRLYDMEKDPTQTRDLSGENLPVMSRLKAVLDAYWAGKTDLRWAPKDDQ